MRNEKCTISFRGKFMVFIWSFKAAKKINYGDNNNEFKLHDTVREEARRRTKKNQEIFEHRKNLKISWHHVLLKTFSQNHDVKFSSNFLFSFIWNTAKVIESRRGDCKQIERRIYAYLSSNFAFLSLATFSENEKINENKHVKWAHSAVSLFFRLSSSL